MQHRKALHIAILDENKSKFKQKVIFALMSTEESYNKKMITLLQGILPVCIIPKRFLPKKDSNNSDANKSKPKVALEYSQEWYFVNTERHQYLAKRQSTSLKDDYYEAIFGKGTSMDTIEVYENGPSIPLATVNKADLIRRVEYSALGSLELELALEDYLLYRREGLKVLDYLMFTKGLEFHLTPSRNISRVTECVPSIGYLAETTVLRVRLAKPTPRSLPSCPSIDSFIWDLCEEFLKDMKQKSLTVSLNGGSPQMKKEIMRRVADKKEYYCLEQGIKEDSDFYEEVYQIARESPLVVVVERTVSQQERFECEPVLFVILDDSVSGKEIEIPIMTPKDIRSLLVGDSLKMSGLSFDQCLDLRQVGTDATTAYLSEPISPLPLLSGYDGLKQALAQVFLWPLHYKEKMEKLGLKAINGALIHGPPGNGKTSLVRSLVGQGFGVGIEADVNTSETYSFLAFDSAEIYSCYVGDSEAKVRNIFKEARAKSPCVLFFDEIDAIVGKRSDGKSNNASDVGTLSLASKDLVQERVLSTFLNEMDGIDSDPNRRVVIIAATNRLDAIDAALLRPGRLERHLYMGNPTSEDKQKIFTQWLSSIPCEDQSLISELLVSTTDNSWSVARCRLLFTEAVMNCISSGDSILTSEHL